MVLGLKSQASGIFVDWHDFGAPSRISQPRRQFRPKSWLETGYNPIYRWQLHPCPFWGHSEARFWPRREDLGGKRPKNGQKRRKRQWDRISTHLDPMQAHYLQHNCTRPYLIPQVRVWRHLEGRYRPRGEEMDGHRRPERSILEVVAASSFFVVWSRESDDKQTSKKVSNRFKISEKICPQATNKIWHQMVENRVSKRTRSKCT